MVHVENFFSSTCQKRSVETYLLALDWIVNPFLDIFYSVFLGRHSTGVL